LLLVVDDDLVDRPVLAFVSHPHSPKAGLPASRSGGCATAPAAGGGFEAAFASGGPPFAADDDFQSPAALKLTLPLAGPIPAAHPMESFE
jgi:hypothetical protein